MKRQHGSPKGQSKPHKRPLDPEFSKRLKGLMDPKGWDAPELARRAKCTKQNIYRLLKNPTTIDPHLLFDVADVFGVSPRWLLTGNSKFVKRDRLLETADME